MNKKTSLTVAAIAAVGYILSLISGCGGISAGASSIDNSSSIQSGKAAEGGTLTIGLDREVQTLDIASSITTQQPLLILSTAVYEPLMKPGAAGNVEPDMAQSLISNDDASQWTLKLRDGLKFSDGSSLKAQQVVDHVKRLADPETKSSAMAQAALISNMETPDDLTVVFTLKTPNADFPSQLVRQLGMIESTTARDDFGFPIGAGPYKVTGFTAGSEVTLARNDNYWGDKPKLDKVVYKMVPDADSRYQSLKSGDLDLMWTEVASQFQDAASNQNLATVTAPASMSMIMLNTKDPALQDVKVRKALARAIDRNSLNKAVNLGEGKIVDNPYALLTSVAPKDSGYPEYDLEAAKKVLDGKGIKLTLSCENRADTVQRATALKDMLGKAGVDVTVNPVESANYTATIMKGDYQMADFMTSILSDPSGASYLFLSKGPYNFTGYKNGAVDRAISDAMTKSDLKSRADDFSTVSKELAKDLPVLWTTAMNSGFIMNKKVVGFPDISKNTLIQVQVGQLALAQN